MVYTYGYLFYVPISVFFAALFAVPGIRKKREAAYYFFALAAVLYINIAIRAAFFPMVIEDIPEWNLLYNINLIPNAAGLFSVHAVLNMLLTFPIGLGIQFVVNAKQKVLWAAVVLSSAFFEAGQLVLLLIIAPLDIIFDVNDLLSNILGAVLGMLLMCGINQRFKGKSCREGKGLGNYMYNVCCRCGNGQKSLG